MPRKGVFWVIEKGGREILLAFPFREGDSTGVAKAGDTYNHRLLWEHVRPLGCNRAYNYYPRGRVEITRQGQVRIYMSPYVSERFIPEVKAAFGITEEPRIHYDFSRHYRCHMG